MPSEQIRKGPVPQVCPHGILGFKKCTECRRAWGRKHQIKRCANETPEQHATRLQERREYYAKNREHILLVVRKYNRKRLTVPFPDGRVIIGNCILCNKNNIKLVPDHDHVTGLFRSWICSTCNIRLGAFEKNRTKFEEYLLKYGGGVHA